MDDMRYVAVAIIYVGFFALIGIAIYLTKSCLPLLALLLMPSFNEGKNGSEED